MSTNSAQVFGAKLRKLRQERGLTLKELSRQAGISEGFLSLVERDKKTPSFGTLLNLLRVLDVSLASLLDENALTGPYLTRADEGEAPDTQHVLPSDRMLTPANSKHVQVLHSVIAPKETSGRRPYVHSAEEEVVIVLKGAIEITVGGETFELFSGDSMLLDPRRPHSYANRTSSPTETIWVLAGGSF